MNLLHLRYAVEVEKAGSITQAAENLYMAQPNLSKALRELESDLNIIIFERLPRGVVPTPKGQEFLAHAKRILAEVELMNSLQQENDENTQAFSLSIPRGSYVAEGFLQFVSKLDFAKPMEIRIKETNSVEAIHNVADNRFRLGIIRFRTVDEQYFLDFMKEKGIQHELIWSFENLLLVSQNNSLAKKAQIYQEDLSNQVEVSHGDKSVPYMTEEILNPSQTGEKDKRIYVYERSTQFEILTRIPSTYMWVSPVPENVLQNHQLVQRKCEFPTQQMKDVLIYSSRYKLTALDKMFVDCLFSVRNQIVFLENSTSQATQA